MMRRTILPVISAGVLAASSMAAQATPQMGDRLRQLAEQQLKAWVADAAVVETVKAQNERNAGLTQDDIDRLDQEWRREVRSGGGELIETTLANPLSAYLKRIKEKAGGLYSEIFVMDNRGLNVGQSDVTSDYWQGDEAKWQKTYLAGSGALHIGEVEFDESSQTYQSQVSLPVVDPATGTVIGAVTVGVNVEALE